MARGTRDRALRAVVAIVVVVLAVGAGVGARPRSGELEGRALAEQLLAQARVPPGAVATNAVITNLGGPPSVIGCSPSWDLHRTYVLDASTDVRAFVQSNLATGELVAGSGDMSGPGMPTVTFFTVSLPSTRGSSGPLILYSWVPIEDRSMALRVDVEVTLPTSRCVTHGVDVAVPDVVAQPIASAMRTVASWGFVPLRVKTELCIGPRDAVTPGPRRG